MANELDVQLHPAQLEIFNSTARFKVVSAGRRFGKSRLAAWILIIKALQSESKDVFYIGPTFQQAKDIMWNMLKGTPSRDRPYRDYPREYSYYEVT